MDIESKIWKYSNTGTRVHCFEEGVALCNSNVRRFTSDAGIDFCEARTHAGLCAKCVTRFNAALEAAEVEQVTETPAEVTEVEQVTETPAEATETPAEVTETPAEATETPAEVTEVEQITNHPDAGTYYPMDGGDYLRVQGLTILAEVHTDGTYAVFAQSQRIDRGRLNGTEGSLMRFFGNIARLWSARIDDERAQEAARRAEAEYAHHAEATIDTARAEALTPEQMATVVEALGGLFMLRDMSDDQDVPTNANTVAGAILNAQQYGYKVEMRDNPEGHRYPWHVSVSNRHGTTRFQYHYMGH